MILLLFTMLVGNGQALAGTRTSVDGFTFRSEERRAQYEDERLVAEVFDVRTSSWSEYSSGVAVATGIDGTSLVVAGGNSKTTGYAREHYEKQYQIVTGDGRVLLSFMDGLAFSARRFFTHIGRVEAYEEHGEWVGSDEELARVKGHRTLGLQVGLAGLSGIPLGIGLALLDKKGSIAPVPMILAFGGGLTGLSALVLRPTKAKLEAAEPHFLRLPWSYEEILPHVKEYNRSLRDRLR